MSNPYEPSDPRPQDGDAPPPPQAPGYGAPQGGDQPAPGAYGGPQWGYGSPLGGHDSTAGGPGRQGTSGLAIASLVTGVLGFLCLTAVAAVVLGIVALTQIHRTGTKGKGLAVTGIVLGVLWLLAGAVAIPAALDRLVDATSLPSTVAPSVSPSTPATTTPSEAETTEPPAGTAVLALGDCVNDPAIVDGDDVPESAVVDCAEPHYAEAYAQFDLPEGDYPGEEAVTAAAEQGCGTEFAAFVGRDYQESVLKVSYFYPTAAVWASDRSVVCIVLGPSGEPVTGSLRGANR